MYVSCPKCEKDVERGGYPLWYWLVGIVLFPVGFLVFLLGRAPSECPGCGHAWVA